MQLIILARAPELGQGKRRLAADIGDSETLKVYQALLARCAAAASAWEGTVTVHGAGDLEQFAYSALAQFTNSALVPQRGGTLAERMVAALEYGLASGPTLLIGSDCPGILPQHLAENANTAAPTQHRLWPSLKMAATGRWAPKARTSCQSICNNSLPWSTETLLSTSVEAIKAHNDDIAFGVQPADCDTVDDLRAAQQRGFHY